MALGLLLQHEGRLPEARTALGEDCRCSGRHTRTRWNGVFQSAHAEFRRSLQEPRYAG